MIIPIHQFEQNINETILKRGLSYFKNGLVQDVVKVSQKQYKGFVSGTSNYLVELEIENNAIIEHNCDCPYDHGPICKHIVAVLFYIQQDALRIQVSATPAKKRQPKKTKVNPVNEILNQLSEDDLKKFVLDMVSTDNQVETSFMATFGHLSEQQNKSFYQKQIRSILKHAKGREGFIFRSKMRYVVQSIQPFFRNAEQAMVVENYKTTFLISSAILEEMNKAIHYADDSDGGVGDMIYQSLQLLNKVSTLDLYEKLNIEIFKYCISTFKKGTFSDWDWHLSILKIAGNLASTEKEGTLVMDLIDTLKEYHQNDGALLKLEILKRFKSEKVKEFIKKNIHHSLIREHEIKVAVDNSEFIRAIRLCEDGIKQNAKNEFRNEFEWHKWLLKIAQIQDDRENIIKYARFLFINQPYTNQDYYQVLKQKFTTIEWDLFIVDLITDVKRIIPFQGNDLLRKIYIEEQSWKELLELVSQNASIYSLESNEEYLAKECTDEFLELYFQVIKEYIENNVSRKHYKTACRYLRRMKKIGGSKKVTELIELFQQNYPQRKALIEELENV